LEAAAMKLSRTQVERKSRALPQLRFEDQQLTSFSGLILFQALFKPACCDVVVWIAVWRDVIRYWVLSANEVETNRYYSKGQHRGNVGEGQLHMTHENIRDFDSYAVQSNRLAGAIRAAYERQQAAMPPS
jgi:hypothetical protein